MEIETPNSRTEIPSSPKVTEEDQWSVQKSADLYGIDYWGAGFFRTGKNGNVCITPKAGSKQCIDLHDLTVDLRERGIRTPILVRFPDIVGSRVDLLNSCFKRTIEEYEYKGKYQGVYPIKVNQQRHLVEEILKAGNQHNMGLEAGSKPELLVALAMIENREALIICNGFKDSEYIQTALLAQKLEKNVIIVVDRFDEIPLIVSLANKLNIKPRLGFRVKLWAKGAGKWVESSGAGSKFGLTPSEIVEGYELLKKLDMAEALELIHFHIGSQITSIHSIKSSLKEAARMYAEVSKLGAKLKFIDVGGGLGVDYDGSGSSDSSINYSEQEYANDVVSILQDTCDEHSIPHPTIVSESGRALVAHQSLLVFDVLGCHKMARPKFTGDIEDSDHQSVKTLYDIYENLSVKNFNESYNDLVTLRQEVNQLFKFGVLDLGQLAKSEDLIWSTITRMVEVGRKCEDCEDIVETLMDELSETYFGNFSVFQSLPDSWAVGQVFPVMPIHRLQEQPAVNANLVDLTCDSDGKIKQFLDVETGETRKTLPVHPIKHGEDYFLGVFLVGAYQEILGDLHNLFGDTDAVHVKVHDEGYTVDHVVQGDTVDEILSYLEYNRVELLDRVRRMSERGILKGTLERKDARLLMKIYEEGLSGYTYLEEGEI